MDRYGTVVRRLSLAVATALLAGCRKDPVPTVQVPSGPDGGTGTGYTAQCSGWFPDWISQQPPQPSSPSFQLSQGYPLGVPVFEMGPDSRLRIVRWDPFTPSTNPLEAPWLAFDFHDPAERAGYLDALKQYLLEGNVEVAFEAQKNMTRFWYHVPMMTSDQNSRREPYHGLTKERRLRYGDHKWIIDGTGAGDNLDSFAIGYYNWLGGYTLGQVFNDPDPANADPVKAQFIPGTVVFKLLFAEHDTNKIDLALDPLVDSPEWEVQDVQNPSAPLKKVRLLQVDVAVRDDRSAQTGWVFGTFVYDKAMTSEPSPWRRLRGVGLQWGNDPDVKGPADVALLDESWIASGIPPVLEHQAPPGATPRPFGREGRLNGPVDNPDSACVSCHSTAQVVLGATPATAFRGAGLFPANACTAAQDMTWFRNVMAGTPFGVMTSNGTGCDMASPSVGTPPLHSMDYSLQLHEALKSSLFFQDPNPCATLATNLRPADGTMATSSEGDNAWASRSMDELREMIAPAGLRDLKQDQLSDLPMAVLRAEDPTAMRLAVDPEKNGLPRTSDADPEDRQRR